MGGVTRDRLPFPPGFLWGTATAAHQVEGDNSNNDWWAFEQQPGAIWHGDRSGLACDWWRNAERDLDLMAEMGHTAHRLSVEWSRIEPQENVFDGQAIDRYRQILSGLRRRGIEPVVTLHHFSSPLWLGGRGGWLNPKVVGHFRRFVHHTVDRLGDQVKLWCTMNESAIYAALGYVSGYHAPGRKSLPSYFRVLRHQLLAHAAAYRVVHALDGQARVGLVHSWQTFDPLDPGDRAAVWLARLLDRWCNGLVVDAVTEGRLGFPMGVGLGQVGELVDSQDFFGLNYYNRRRVSLRPHDSHRLPILGNTPGAEMSDCGRDGSYGEVYPAGIYRVLKKLAGIGKPIYITETGLPDADDDQRPRFLLTHLAQLQRAIAEGVDVRGLFHWTFTDNFEWSEGWGLRFGLVALDQETQERTPRPSARLYSEIIRANAITQEMVEEWAPEALGDIFP